MKIWILKGNCGYKSSDFFTQTTTWISGYFTDYYKMEAFKMLLEIEMIKAEENQEFIPKGDYPSLRVGERNQKIRDYMNGFDPKFTYYGYKDCCVWWDYEEAETKD